MHLRRFAIIAFALLVAARSATAESGPSGPDPGRFNPGDVFDLEWASDPQLSPDGTRIVYVRNFMDVMSDRHRSNLWIVDVGGSNHRPLTTGTENDNTPR